MKVTIVIEDTEGGNVNLGCDFSETSSVNESPAALLAAHIILWAYSVADKPLEVPMIDC